VDISGYVGPAIRALRERLALSQEELAHRADLDRTYVSGIERGRRNPSLSSLQRIVTALNTQLDVLFIAARRLAQQDIKSRKGASRRLR
jgi:transcriptional regulator with XRE-family HTH domain